MPRKRQLPDGMKIRNGEYHCDLYAGGRRIRKRLSGDFNAACTILNDLKARADRADFGLLDNDVALSEIRAEYLRHRRQALEASTVDRYEDNLDKILPRIGATRASQINVRNVVTYRQERLDEGASPGTFSRGHHLRGQFGIRGLGRRQAFAELLGRELE